MTWAERLRRSWPSSGAPRAVEEEDLGADIREAHRMLSAANRRGFLVPGRVVERILVAQRHYHSNRTLTPELEVAFWNAYAVLRSSIESSAQARRLYRSVFYAALGLMLIVQLYYVFGSKVHGEATRLEEALFEVQGQMAVVQLSAQGQNESQGPAAPATGEGGVAGLAPAPLDALQQKHGVIWGELAAYNQMAYVMVHLPSYLRGQSDRGPVVSDPGGDGAATAASQALAWQEYIATKSSLATLNLILDFLAAYVLPALYGLLGACAFVLRQLSDDVVRLRFAHEQRVRYSLRLNIGLLAGLAVGWFITPDQSAGVLANLSPLAIAFVAGYASDLLFAALDRIVHAFSSNGGAPAAEPAAPVAIATSAKPAPREDTDVPAPPAEPERPRAA